MKLGILANLEKPSAQRVINEVERFSEQVGIQLVTSGDTARLLPQHPCLNRSDFPEAIDTLMALGGDGSLLSAVEYVRGADIPIIGVNLGQLGFMTSVREDRVSQAMQCLAEGSFTTSTRSLIACEVNRNGQISKHRALNDVVLGWGPSSRVANIEVWVEGQTVTTYTCDGIIASTPTGSTGHSLSAGGPILHPETAAFVLTVICPHTMSVRPLILPDSSAIEMQLEGSSKTLLLSVDGRPAGELESGTRLRLRKADTGIRLIHLPDYSYYDVLRTKLNWRGSSIR